MCVICKAFNKEMQIFNNRFPDTCKSCKVRPFRMRPQYFRKYSFGVVPLDLILLESWPHMCVTYTIHSVNIENRKGTWNSRATDIKTGKEERKTEQKISLAKGWVINCLMGGGARYSHTFDEISVLFLSQTYIKIVIPSNTSEKNFILLRCTLFFIPFPLQGENFCAPPRHFPPLPLKDLIMSP